MAGNKHLLFLVHGMGKHGDDWSVGMQNAIRAAYESYANLANFDFDTFFEFAPLGYDQHFDDLRKQWADQANSLLQFLEPLAAKGELDAVNKTITKLARGSQGFGKDDFARTHLLDVFLYRFATQSRHTVRTKVQDQILEKIKQLDKKSPIRWSVIAHSLGTAVAHDALHEMFTAKIKNAPDLVGLTYPNALVMLANVSRLLESDIDVFTSVVAPGAPDSPRFAVRQYVNAFHEFDPIAAAGPFDPVSTWPAPGVRDAGLYTSVRISDIEELNVHAAEHHIRNPRVHVPMLNAILGTKAIDQPACDAAYAKYRQLLPVNKINQLVDQLKRYKPKPGDNPAKILRGWRDFLDAI